MEPGTIRLHVQCPDPLATLRPFRNLPVMSPEWMGTMITLVKLTFIFRIGIVDGFKSEWFMGLRKFCRRITKCGDIQPRQSRDYFNTFT